jgi:dipeptidyl aminopeptidase/acylaminoacyl peptidase
MMYKSIKTYTLLLAMACSGQLAAQTVTRFQPTHEQMTERYRRAARIDSLTKNAVFKSAVEAHWAGDEKSFWYCNILKDSVREYIYVDAASGKKQPLNSEKLANALQKNGVSTDPRHMVIDNIIMPAGKKTIQIETAGKWFELSADGSAGTKINPPASAGIAVASGPRKRQRGGRFGNFRNGSVSPDKKWEAYIEKGNLFAKPVGGGNVVRFTTDGSEAVPYGAMTWSPDSKYLAGYHIHPVKDADVYIILTAVPGTTRGQLRPRPYKQPGDPFTTYDLFLFPVDQKKAVKVNAEAIDFSNTAPELHWRYDNAQYFTYEKFDRGHQRFRVIEVDANTGQTRNVVDDKTNTFIYKDRQYTHYPKGSNLLVRSSEKDGWRHIYSVDLVTGKEQLITKGDWIVRDVDSVDMVKKEIWFTGSGMNAGEDPYLVYYYRIGMDGKNLMCLTPDKGNHSVVFSPDRKYFTDNYSLVNVPPVTKLRRSADGKEIALLESADVSYYNKSGVKPPEVFVAKARDGVTDIWGIVSRPSDYDPAKKYPVLENIYAGPHDSFVPKSFVPYSEMQSLAELGFIVVMIDGMGTANRSKAFHDVCWQNLADAGLPDRILWIKALAQKYQYVDAERVGIYGTSAGGQNSLGALLFHPEFYKACVSACGCHDNRVDKQSWNEQWMGYPVGKHYDEQSNVTNAAKLKGNVLLIVGESDTNVPPESTYRVADALIKAGKNFDFLSIPGMDHSDGGPFGRIKKRNFFVKHLMDVDPPDINSGELPFTKEVGRERWSFQ